MATRTAKSRKLKPKRKPASKPAARKPKPAPKKTSASSAQDLATLAEKVVAELFRKVKKQPDLARRLGRCDLVEVSVVGMREMTELNARFRQKDQPTDVLSFPAPADFKTYGILGEIVLCSPVLQAQAKQHQHSDEAELYVLMTHGFLHLLGFDHEAGPHHQKVMAAWEAKLLKSKRGLIARTG